MLRFSQIFTVWFRGTSETQIHEEFHLIWGITICTSRIIIKIVAFWDSE
jgi:hypothetical protein